MEDSLVYLDTYVLQQDMRIRIPKMILTNLNAARGVTRFDIYLDTCKQSIVLKKRDSSNDAKQEESK